MSNIEITIKLPEELLQSVQNAGLQIDDLPSLIEEQIVQREKQLHPRITSLSELADRIAELPDELKPTPEEIDEGIQTARKEINDARHVSKSA